LKNEFCGGKFLSRELICTAFEARYAQIAERSVCKAFAQYRNIDERFIMFVDIEEIKF